MISLAYRLKVRALKRPRLNRAWRRWRAWMGDEMGAYGMLPDLIRAHAPGKSFVDVGCMWGVNGEYAFLAEQAGATAVTGVDVFGPTPEFEERRIATGSAVRFVLGDAGHPAVIERVGVCDVVFCAGVLYHHPSPFDLLVALRSLCRQTLILRSSTIPEVDGLPNMAIHWPMLAEAHRELWRLNRLGVMHQEGISGPFNPAEGYGNWFWGLTPSCLEAMLATAGFRVERRLHEAFAQTMICAAADRPFAHRLPDADEAAEMGRTAAAAPNFRPN